MVEIDAQVFRLIHDALSRFPLFMLVLSTIGGGWGSLAVVPLVIESRTRRAGGLLALVLVVTAIVVFVLKQLVGRVRPCFCLAGLERVMSSPPTDASFPSGHAAGSAAFAVFVGVLLLKSASENASRRERTLRGAAVVLVGIGALGVGLSRIALGVHFPGDVLGGVLVGAAVAAIGARIHFMPRASSRRGS